MTSKSIYTDKKFIVYALWADTDAFPFYIGEGVRSRPKQHFKPSSLKQNTHKNNKINKLISEGIKIHIVTLEEVASKEESLKLERAYINDFKLASEGGCLTNAVYGGGGIGGWKHSDDTKLKIGIASRSWIRSEETCRKISEANTGSKRPHSSQLIKDRIALGTHIIPNKGASSWETSTSNIEMWCNAELFKFLYDLFGGINHKILENAFNLNYHTTNLISKIKSGWVPDEDMEYLQWRNIQNYTQLSITPSSFLYLSLHNSIMFNHAVTKEKRNVVYKNSYEIYDAVIKFNFGRRKIQQLFNKDYDYSGVIKAIKSGWNPYVDANFKLWETYGFQEISY